MSNIRDGLMVATAAGGVLGILGTVEFGAPAAIAGVAVSLVSLYFAVTSGRSQQVSKTSQPMQHLSIKVSGKPATSGNSRQRKKQRHQARININAERHSHESVQEVETPAVVA